MSTTWEVHLSRNAKKQYQKLKKSGQNKPSIIDTIDFLLIEIESMGPERLNWPNYGKLSKDTYHCHLKKGHPTYVACWKLVSAEEKKIEVYYVGTHEGSPY